MIKLFNSWEVPRDCLSAKLFESKSSLPISVHMSIYLQKRLALAISSIITDAGLGCVKYYITCLTNLTAQVLIKVLSRYCCNVWPNSCLCLRSSTCDSRHFLQKLKFTLHNTNYRINDLHTYLRLKFCKVFFSDVVVKSWKFSTVMSRTPYLLVSIYTQKRLHWHTSQKRITVSSTFFGKIK